MSYAIISFTENGGRLAKKIAAGLQGQGVTAEITDGRDPGSLNGFTSRYFESGNVMLFIGAAGTAVRAIAPFLKSEETDPSVLVTDERGEYVISILSGRIGGASEEAARIARITGGEAAVTSAAGV